MSRHREHGNQHKGMSSQGGFSFSTSPRELVEEHPISTTLLAFGVGLSVGVLIGQTVVGALVSEPEPASRLDSLSRQVCDAVRSSVPEAISRYLPR
jgi:hypothetical protein